MHHYSLSIMFLVLFSSKRRHTRCALVTGVQTCALPISSSGACVSPRCAVRVIPTRLVKHGLDVSAAHGGQALDQGRPVDVAVESHHVQSRDAGAFDDSKTVAG